jgi:hypothetical protein
MMCEQRLPKDLVDDLVRAERVDFDFSRDAGIRYAVEALRDTGA